MIRHFSGRDTRFLRKMIFLLALIVSIFIAPAIATGEEDLTAELLSSRKEMVKLAGYGEDKLSTVVIGGRILCHAAPGAKISGHPVPVSGATVAVFCSTSGRKKGSWANGNTNIYGEFVIDLPSHLHAIPNLEKICVAHVLHLPKSSPCRQAFTGKYKSIKLASIGNGVRTYTANDIHLMPIPSEEHMRRGGDTEHTVSDLR